MPRASTRSKPIATATAAPEDAAQQIDAKIAALDDWRGKTLAQLRSIIHKADPDVVETVKWRGCRSGSTTASSVPAKPTKRR